MHGFLTKPDCPDPSDELRMRPKYSPFALGKETAIQNKNASVCNKMLLFHLFPPLRVISCQEICRLPLYRRPNFATIFNFLFTW